MPTKTFLKGLITVTSEWPFKKWVATLENGLRAESVLSAEDAAGRLIDAYPAAVTEFVIANYYGKRR